jgi:hypothetical protein
VSKQSIRSKLWETQSVVSQTSGNFRTYTRLITTQPNRTTTRVDVTARHDTA